MGNYRGAASTLVRYVKYLCDPLGSLSARKYSGSYAIGGNYKRIYHYHIRKTAGTSLNNMFLSLSGRDGGDVYRAINVSLNNRVVIGDKVFVGWNPLLLEKGNYFYGFSHLPAHAVNIPENSFTFTSLRDPAERVISLYRMLRFYVDNNIPHAGLIAQRDWLGRCFEDFLDRLPRNELLGQIYMFSERLDFAEALKNIQKCTFVMFMDSLSEDVTDLSERLKLPLSLKHLRSSGNEVGISEPAKIRLKKMVEIEFEMVNELKRKI